MPSAPRVNSRGESRYILNMRIDATCYQTACDRIVEWARAGEGRSVFCATVHMVMEGFDRPAYRKQVNRADLVTSDGMPLVWALRGLGVAGATRVYGPDLMNVLLEQAAAEGLWVGFLGGSPATLERLIETTRRRHPALRIGFAQSPPFRHLTPQEDAEIVQRIGSAGVRILFVGLGCPKQERWIAEHRESLACVALAVGAAFDFLAGTMPQAPRWMQSMGMEWLFRLAVEPRRLWKRYLTTNPRFIWHFGTQLLFRGTGLAEGPTG
jgi:N-acetylglucosaminyldiphosphoundecaprenol N-acetyl-beta-D-mannosaminyltransferase